MQSCIQVAAHIPCTCSSLQITQQQIMYSDLEATLAEKLEEHDVFESQFTAEHEEEVRALRQQKQHLMQQLEEAKEHYQTILDDQEQQVQKIMQHSPSQLFYNHHCI